MATTDWDAEAKQICRAFNIDERCVFVGPLKGKALRPISNQLNFKVKNPSLGDALFLSVLYTSTRKFAISNDSRKCLGRVEIRWSGRSRAKLGKGGVCPSVFAKGLFNLGFLTPEIEAELQLSITQHEKLEWQVEFEALNKFT